MRFPTLWIAASAIIAFSSASGAAEEAKGLVVEDGRNISIELTLSLDDGTQIQTNVGAEPVVIEQGKHQIFPAVEKAIAGMKVGESRKVKLGPAEGFGEPDPNLLKEVDVAEIPEGARKAGTQLTAEDPQGNQHQVRVHEVRSDKIVVDLNHPLAGKTVYFDVKVLKIE